MASAARSRNGFGSLLILAMLVAAVAAFSAQFDPGDWYAQLDKPSWNPPDWVFAPVWTLIYIAIAIAGWLIWRAIGLAHFVLPIWGLQLVLNALWSALFFGWHRPGLALLDLILLLILIVAFVVLARRRSVLASLLFVPYAVWVAFAGVLNLVIWRVNQ